MATNYYVMPLTGVGTRQDPRRPIHQDAIFPGADWGMIDYGNEAFCLVGLPNVTPAIDSALQGQPNVFALPTNLDQTMGTTGTRNTVRNRLEAVNIPGNWVQTSDSFRTVTRFVFAVCQLAQRYQGLVTTFNVWFTGGVTLDSAFNALPVQKQIDFQTMAASDWYTTTGVLVHFDTSVVVSTNNLRTILKSLGDQYVTFDLPLNLQGAL